MSVLTILIFIQRQNLEDDLWYWYQSYFDSNFYLNCETTDDYNLSETGFISHVNEEDFFQYSECNIRTNLLPTSYGWCN